MAAGIRSYDRMRHEQLVETALVGLMRQACDRSTGDLAQDNRGGAMEVQA